MRAEQVELELAHLVGAITRSLSTPKAGVDP